jgi:DNA-binding transcriptional LysR family regulator
MPVTNDSNRKGSLDLNLLALFEAIHRCGNLTAAGAERGLSQPSVSRGLARLRAFYGDALFVRQQRGVQATPFADRLAEQVRTGLATLQGVQDKPSFEPSRDARSFRVAMTDIAERYFLPELLAHLQDVAPQVQIESLVSTSTDLATGLANGQIDLAVGYLPDLPKQVRLKRLFREEFVCVARRDHPVVRGTLNRRQWLALPHLIVDPPGTPHAKTVERALQSQRQSVAVLARVRSFLCAPPIVAQTDALAALPSNLVRLFSATWDLQRLPPPRPIPGFDVCLAWHERYHRDPALSWLRGVFVERFGSARGA